MNMFFEDDSERSQSESDGLQPVSPAEQLEIMQGISEVFGSASQEEERLENLEAAGFTVVDHNGSPAWTVPSSTNDSTNLKTLQKFYRYADKGTMRRRRYPIRGAFGANGTGKTLMACHDMIPSLTGGRTVLSTAPFVDPFTGNPHPNWVPWYEASQMIAEDSYGVDILGDEIQSMFSSRDTAGLSSTILNRLNQLRKNDNSFSYTGPNYSLADKILRQVTQLVTVTRGYLPTPRRDENGKIFGLWQNNRLFRWTSYNGAEMNNWTDSTEGKLKGLDNQWVLLPKILLGKQLLASVMYDSYAEVIRQNVTDRGSCVRCGGRIANPVCKCNDRTSGFKLRIPAPEQIQYHSEHDH